MNPYVDSNEYVRPKNTSGMNCPLLNRPCLKTCHNCELWQPVELEAGGKTKVVWKCAFNWAVGIQTINSLKLNGMQAAMEGLRNHFHHFRESVITLVGAMARASRLIEQESPPRTLEGEVITNASETGARPSSPV